MACPFYAVKTLLWNHRKRAHNIQFPQFEVFLYRGHEDTLWWQLRLLLVLLMGWHTVRNLFAVSLGHLLRRFPNPILPNIFTCA